jgi:hypothetical protein
MTKNLLTNIVKNKHIIYRWFALRSICTPITAMKTKFFYLSILWIFESDLLVIHLNDTTLTLLIRIEGPYTHYNLDAISHEQYLN